MEIPEICTFEQSLKYLPFMTKGRLRNLIFKNKEFKSKCSRKFGKNMFILPNEVIKFIKDLGT